MTSQYHPADYDELDPPPLHHRRKGLVAYVPGWLALGLLVSLGVHGWAVYMVRTVPLELKTAAPLHENTFAAFDVKRVVLPDFAEEQPLPDEPEVRPEPIMDMEQFQDQLDTERQNEIETTIDELRVTPGAKPVPDDFLEQLRETATVVSPQDIAKVRKAAGESGEALVQGMQDQIEQDLLETTTGAANQPKILVGALKEKLRGPTSADGFMEPQGYSNIDDLLGRTGPLPSNTAPLMMPSDVLFASNQAELQPQAVTSLQKLGQLLRKHPEVTFVVEGHTDSFGSDAYNIALSERRAESVRAWLISSMGIAPERIATKGYGKSKLIAPATGDVFEQQLNRRVEILIRTP